MRAIFVWLLFLVSTVCHASMVWSGVAVDPKLVPRLKSDEKFLLKTLFESPKGDSVHLDKAWHGIHFLLTGSPDRTDSLASRAIMGGESIGADLGYGRAQLLSPLEVRLIARALQRQPADRLAARYKPEALARAHVYPEVIWEREKDEARDYVLQYYKALVAFYDHAAAKGYAVVFTLH